MRNIIFLINTFFIFASYKKANAISPEECIKSLTNSNGNDPKFAASKNIYCAYIPDGTIKKGTFNIRRSRINDWDITVDKLNDQNVLTNTKKLSIINKQNKKNNMAFNFTLENSDSNVIIWTLNRHHFGSIEEVELEVENEKGIFNVNLENKKINLKEPKKTNTLTEKDTSKLEKRVTFDEVKKNCFAFSTKEKKLVWEDISWDRNKEKTINYETGEITINDSKYLNTLAFYFYKEGDNNRGTNNYFTNDFTLTFQIKTDSNKWMVYVGEHNKNTNEVSFVYTWNLTPDFIEKYDEDKGNKLPQTAELDIKKYYTMKLKISDSEEKEIKFNVENNIILIVNKGEDNNSQKISVKELEVLNCNNVHDKDEPI